ncbi:MAG: DUF507 family protein [Acidobacteria bacterium]|nr:DUF507 family protein [Acidobacteriota bacterium]
MRLNHERCVHLSHRFLEALEEEDSVDFLRDLNVVRLRALQILEAEMMREEEMEESIRRRITTQKRDIPEGSPEWEVLFRNYYEEEVRKIRRVRE